MKKLQVSLNVIVLVTLTVFYSSCRQPKQASCDCCNSFVKGGSTIKKVATLSGTIIEIKVPTAFTPSNLAFCDSNVYDKTIPCRKNIDSVYNDNINDYFHIFGIDSFPENLLIIKTPGDTTAIDRFVNYSNVSEGHRVFNGIKIDTTLYGHERQRQLTSGKYQFILQLYKTKDHLKTERIDSISGNFCIIRVKDFCNVGCEGKDKNDPLINK